MEFKGGSIKVNGKSIVITITDSTQTFGPSASGKTLIIASTEGNKPVDVQGKQVVIGLNVYTKR